MKRILCLSVIAVILMSLVPITAGAYNGTKYGDYLYYEVNENGDAIMITDCDTSAEGKIVIPAQIYGIAVTSIGDNAFSYIRGITSINIPDSVTSIGERAFYYCSSLTSIIMPDDVASIGGEAFYNCSSLTSITIPGAVTSIGERAFSGCDSLMSINVNPKNNYYCSVDGNLFDQNKETLIQYAIGKSNSEYTIPDSVVSIGERAFYNCSSLTSITITGGVTSIGESAFQNCSRLTDIDIPDSIISIGGFAFDGCSSLTSLVIPEGVRVIDEFTLGHCTALKRVEIPKNITKVGSFAFYGCENLTDFELPDGITEIGDNILSGTPYSKDSENFEDNVLYYKHYALESKDGEVDRIYRIKDGTKVISGVSFNNVDKYIIPPSVKSICGWSFQGSYDSPLNIVFEGDFPNLYYGRTYAGVETYPFAANIYSAATSLVNIYYNAANSSYTEQAINSFIKSYPEAKFYPMRTVPLKVKPVEPIIDEAAGTVEIPVTVTEPERAAELNEIELYIAEYDEDGRFIGVTLGEKSAVKDDTIIAKGTIPKTNNYKIMLWDVNQAPLMSAIEGGAKSDENTSDDSSLTYNIDNNEVTITGCADGVADIVIPSKIDGLPVTEIANEAFYENHSLKSVYIEEGINWIGLNAFYGCDNLLSIHIPDTLETVLDMAFGDCKKLTDITINENSDSYVIKDGVLFDKDMMRLVLAPRNISGSYTVPDGVLVIGTSAFDSCYNLKEINFAGGIKVIEQMAFGDCTGLTSLKIPFEKGITFRDYFHGDSREDTEAKACEIGQSAFYGCSNIKSVVIYTVPNSRYTIDERGYLYIDYRAFFDCSALEKIYLPCDTRSIDEQAFNYCDALRDVYFEGTEEDDITVNENNKGFFNSTMHYNFAAPLL